MEGPQEKRQYNDTPQSHVASSEHQGQGDHASTFQGEKHRSQKWGLDQYLLPTLCTRTYQSLDKVVLKELYLTQRTMPRPSALSPGPLQRAEDTPLEGVWNNVFWAQGHQAHLGPGLGVISEMRFKWKLYTNNKCPCPFSRCLPEHWERNLLCAGR